MNNIASNIESIVKEIHLAEKQYQRSVGSVQLLAVSKQQSIEAIMAAHAAGLMRFGENYVQEALPKIKALATQTLEWHFIGTIQDNKTKLIAENFSWVQSVTRLKTAERLNKQRPKDLGLLNICIEVNVAAENSKTGMDINDLPALVKGIQSLENLKLRGLMTIAPHITDFSAQRKTFQKLHEIFLSLNQQGLALDTLSMGMTNDFQAATAAGSTMVRVGTAIFGARHSN